MSDDDESIAAGSDDEANEGNEGQESKQFKRKRITVLGSWVLVVLIASTKGLWYHCGNLGCSFEAAQQSFPDGHAVALVLTRWEFLTPQASQSGIPAPLLKLEKLRSRAAARSGYLA